MCECFSEEFRERFEKWSVEASMLDQTGSTGVHSSLETTPLLSLISVLHQQSNQSGNFLSVLKNLKLQFLGTHNLQNLLCPRKIYSAKLYLKVACSVSVSYSAFDAFSSAQLVKSKLLMFLGLGRLQVLIEELQNVFVS